MGRFFFSEKIKFSDITKIAKFARSGCKPFLAYNAISKGNQNNGYPYFEKPEKLKIKPKS